MEIRANAKINLCLDITGIRDDGYHILDMVMQELDISDEITIEKSSDITIKSDIELPEKNTVSTAVRLFFEYTGIDGGADIFLKKHIPAQSGLGGGSSDAAAVLKALDELYDTNLGYDRLCEIGIKIGSDVPFFIKGGTARVAGVGDNLCQIDNNIDCCYILAKPYSGVSTAEAYAGYHEAVQIHPDIMSVVDALRDGDLAMFAENTGNLLTASAQALNPDVSRTIALFTDADCTFMTGSGSCVFGMYRNREHAENALERIRKEEFISFCEITEAVRNNK